MRLALASLTIRFPLPPPAPQSGFPHPAPQTLGMELEPIVAGQVLAGVEEKLCLGMIQQQPALWEL
jgi:hypothetical protein